MRKRTRSHPGIPRRERPGTLFSSLENFILFTIKTIPFYEKSIFHSIFFLIFTRRKKPLIKPHAFENKYFSAPAGRFSSMKNNRPLYHV
jgi:hypothetical protein